MCVKRVSGGGGHGRRPTEQVPGIHYFGRSYGTGRFEFEPAEPAETIDARLQRLHREMTSLVAPFPQHSRVQRDARRLWKDAWKLRTTAERRAHEKLDELEKRIRVIARRPD